MTALRSFVARVVGLFRTRRRDEELQEEIQSHLERLADEHTQYGLSPAEARAVALRAFGGIDQMKETYRDQRGLQWVDSLIHDARYAVRSLRRSPAFTAVAVVMLAFGIGINAMMFTVTNAVLFKGFPLVSRNDRLLYMSTMEAGGVSYADFEEWRAQARSFEQMVLVHGTHHVYSDEGGMPERFTTEVSAGTFGLVGQAPMLGRDFASSDEIPGAAPVAMLSHRFWQRRYASDPTIVGRAVRVNGVPTTVIGVMPQGFTFPQNQDLWVPLVPTPETRKPGNYEGGWFVLGRLADGVTARQARAEMAALGQRPNRASGDRPINVYDFQQFFIGPTAPVIYEAMWGAVALVLLVACANLANLLIGRAMGRSREISVRIALGAGRWRIIRQLLIESVMLSALGGACGWWIATWGVRLFASVATGSGLSPYIGGDWFDDVLDYSLDYRVFAYLVAISIGTGLLFGLAPASRLSNLDVNATLKDGGRGAAGARSRHLSAALVVAEMALAVVLLAGAGVLIRSFLKIYSADLGFSSDNVVAAQFALPKAGYADAGAQTSFFDRLTTRLGTSPGMESVAIAQSQPGIAAWQRDYERAGAPPAETRRRPLVLGTTIGPGYFRTLGSPVVAGREFEGADGTSGSPAVIVTQRFASENWRDDSALGKRLRLFAGNVPGPWLTVVGVVRNLDQKGGWSEQAIDPRVYLPYRQQPAPGMWVLARSRVPLAAVTAAFRGEVHAIDATLPIQNGPLSLSDQLARRYQYRGITGALFLMCATVALLLASIGLYAVVAHAVSLRTQEIGVRMAIGATARDILTLVCRQGMPALGAGLALGLAASVAVNRVLQSQLVEVSPSDPLTLVGVSVVLASCTMLGCLIPARRALNVDPVVALRHD